MIKDIEPSLPITRRVAVGRPAAAPGAGPTKLDHFEVTRDFAGNAFARDEAAHKLLGDKPRTIPIRFLSDVLEENLAMSHQLWAGPNLLCEGDGETARRRDAVESRLTHVVPCHSKPQVAPGDGWPDRGMTELLEWKKGLAEKTADKSRLGMIRAGIMHDDAAAPWRCPFAQERHCKVVSQLVFEIRGLAGLARYRSHGMKTAKELLGSLALVMNATNGVLQNVPLVLVCKWGRVTTPDGKSVGAPIVHVEAENALQLQVQAAAIMQSRRGLTESINNERKLLRAVQYATDPEAIAREFTEDAEELTAERMTDATPSGGIKP